MNPFDNVGTTRLSTSVHDRMCRLADELPGRRGRAGHRGAAGPVPDRAARQRDRLIADAVAVTRATREHEDIRQGSSVRGAIDLTLVAGQLLELAGRRPAAPTDPAEPGERYAETVYDAMVVALSGPDLPRRDRGADPRAGAAADLGGPLHPGPGHGRAWLKSGRGRLSHPAAETAAAAAAEAAAPPAQGSRRGAHPAANPAGAAAAAWSLRRRPAAARRRPPASRQRRARRRPGSRARCWSHRPGRGHARPRGAAPGPADRHPAGRAAAPARTLTARRGVGELASVRYRGGSDDIDLDRTLEQLVEHPVPDDEDIIVRERIRTRRAVVLLVDVSGSMRGERVRTAAATVGALAAELARDDLAVMAFWSDAALLERLGQHAAAHGAGHQVRIPARA